MPEQFFDPMGFLSGALAMTGFNNSVLNCYKKAPAQSLDVYYSFQTATSDNHLDASGKPVYQGTSDASTIYSSYRFEPGDLERCTVIVPDISLIQEGDLIVHFGVDEESKGDPTHVGIVVALGGTKPEFGSDGSSYMKNVYVVSVRKDFRQVTLGTWGNPEGQFGGFSTEPEKYHIRRFIKNAGNGEYQPAKWDICSPVSSMDLEILSMYEHTITVTNKDGARERWIPNTGEFLVLNLTGTLRNSAGAVVSSTGEDQEILWEIYPTGAIDRGATEGDGVPFDNNPDSRFELYLIDDTGNGNTCQKIGELRYNTTMGVYQFDTTGSTIYQPDGALKSAENCLYLDVNNRVTGKIGTARDLRLAIRPTEAARAFPGDDLLLSFNVRMPGATQGLLADPVTLKEKDYIAVYDKKMLWRANLYIDEGEGDWNKIHPWNVPPNGTDGPAWWSSSWGYNEWNRTYDAVTNTSPLNLTGSATAEGYLTDTCDFMTDLALADGKQTFNIPPVTWHNNTLVSKAVCYSMSCHDSPFEYGSKVHEQRILIENAIRTSLAPFTGGNAESTYGHTRAPHQNTPNWIGEGMDWVGVWNKYRTAQATLNNVLYYPYRPGLSSSAVGDDNATRRQSAGVDCVGLVQRAASWSGESYEINNILGYIWTTASPWGFENHYRLFPTINNALDLVTSKDDVVIVNEEQTYPQLKYVVPGDIIYYTGHVMMVSWIEDTDSTVGIADVKIIESTFGNYGQGYGYLCSVVKKCTIDKYSARDWVVGRFKWSN